MKKKNAYVAKDTAFILEKKDIVEIQITPFGTATVYLTNGAIIKMKAAKGLHNQLQRLYNVYYQH